MQAKELARKAVRESQVLLKNNNKVLPLSPKSKVLVIGATAAFAPKYISMLWTDPAGRHIAIFCTVWMLAGFLVLRRMARIEV